MPGLAELEAAKPGQIAIDYRDVDTGAQLSYRTQTRDWRWRFTGGSTHSSQAMGLTRWQAINITTTAR